MLARPLLVPLLLSSAGIPLVPRTSVRLLAKPRTRGVENYRTVSVVCAKCSELLFRYKKKNGLQSNLIKCYIERIVDDPHALLTTEREAEVRCPSCQSGFARDAVIHGRPALKMVGGKIRMQKK